MTQFNLDAARQYAYERLSQELAPTLHYHCLAHTFDDVVPAAVRFGRDSGFKGEDLGLIETAAIYHDIGYLVGRQEHENIGVDICYEVLPTFGYRPAHLERIAAMIMATQLPQNATTLEARIIADADMDSLGREDFLHTSLALRRELESIGIYRTDAEWFRGQLFFLKNHRYFTNAAQRLRQQGKEKNMQLLGVLLTDARRREA